jgi:hypothetical protein
MDHGHSAEIWNGLNDPGKTDSVLTPSVDEEETPLSKVRSLVQKEIDLTPEKMTYALRVLNKLLKSIDSM